MANILKILFISIKNYFNEIWWLLKVGFMTTRYSMKNSENVKHVIEEAAKVFNMGGYNIEFYKRYIPNGRYINCGTEEPLMITNPDYKKVEVYLTAITDQGYSACQVIAMLKHETRHIEQFKYLLGLKYTTRQILTADYYLSKGRYNDSLLEKDAVWFVTCSKPMHFEDTFECHHLLVMLRLMNNEIIL